MNELPQQQTRPWPVHHHCAPPMCPPPQTRSTLRGVSASYQHGVHVRADKTRHAQRDPKRAREHRANRVLLHCTNTPTRMRASTCNCGSVASDVSAVVATVDTAARGSSAEKGTCDNSKGGVSRVIEGEAWLANLHHIHTYPEHTLTHSHPPLTHSRGHVGDLGG